MYVATAPNETRTRGAGPDPYPRKDGKDPATKPTEYQAEADPSNKVGAIPNQAAQAIRAPDDDQQSMSVYWSAKSSLRKLSFSSSLRRFSHSSSRLSDSSGRPSVEGATWSQSLNRTMNSGFGPAGAPRSIGNKGVREGREKGGFLPRLLGVGRTGKKPAVVPDGLIDAAKKPSEPAARPEQTEHVPAEELQVEDREEYEAEKSAILARHQRELQDQSADFSRRAEGLRVRHGKELNNKWNTLGSLGDNGQKRERLIGIHSLENEVQIKEFRDERDGLSAKYDGELAALNRKWKVIPSMIPTIVEDSDDTAFRNDAYGEENEGEKLTVETSETSVVVEAEAESVDIVGGVEPQASTSSNPQTHNA